MITKPTILVIGATGQVGGETVRQLVTAGDSRVLAAVRSPGSESQPRLHPTPSEWKQPHGYTPR